MRRRMACGVLTWLGCGLLQAQPSLAPAKAKPEVKETTIEMELMTNGDNVAVQAQAWGKALSELNIGMQMRLATAGEKPEIKEQMLGRLRRVKVIGTLDRTGKVTVPGKQLTLGDRARLKEWVDELKAYGAQGSPQGQPGWGLNQEQFTAFYEALTERVTTETRDVPLETAIAGLAIPATYPVRWTEDAKALRKDMGELHVAQELKGFSAAMALAVMLNDHGFGMRPQRTPSGRIEVLVAPRQESETFWPIGWPLQKSRADVLPKMFTMQTIAIDPTPFSEVLAHCMSDCQAACLVDYYAINREQLSLGRTKVSYGPKRMSYSVALRAMAAQAKMRHDLLQDELGRPFVWVTGLNSPARSQPAE